MLQEGQQLSPDAPTMQWNRSLIVKFRRNEALEISTLKSPRCDSVSIVLY